MKDQQLYYLSKYENDIHFAVSLWPDRVENGYVPNKNADRKIIWTRDKKKKAMAEVFLDGLTPVSFSHLRDEHGLLLDIFGDY